MSAEQLVLMFHDDTLYSFERADKIQYFTFGGPLEEKLTGVPTGPRPLHMVARLNVNGIPQLAEALWKYRINCLSLIYGFNYDGCEIEYEMKTGGDIKILKLWPGTSCDDFPYANYPVLLPYVPLKLSESRPCTYAEFAERIPNMPEKPPAKLIVAVHPPDTLRGSRCGGQWGTLKGLRSSSNATSPRKLSGRATDAPDRIIAARYAVMKRAALIGAGQIARQHLACLRELPGVEVAAVCDLSRAMAESAAERFHVPAWYTDSRRPARRGPARRGPCDHPATSHSRWRRPRSRPART